MARHESGHVMLCFVLFLFFIIILSFEKYKCIFSVISVLFDGKTSKGPEFRIRPNLGFKFIKLKFGDLDMILKKENSSTSDMPTRAHADREDRLSLQFALL